METKVISSTQTKNGDVTVKVTLTKLTRLLSKDREISIFNISIVYIEDKYELSRDWETYSNAHRDYVNTIEGFLY